MVSIEEINRITFLNEKLLDVMKEITLEIINYANKHHLELPKNVHSLWKEANTLINQIQPLASVNKKCSICNKLNPENAEYCCYCGTKLNWK